MRRVIVAALAAALLLGARSGSMAWQENQRSLQPVEQQGNIANPTDCPWDPDDVLSGTFSGRLERGASVSHTDCLILDKQSHLVGLKVGAGLAGSIAIDGIEGPTFTGEATAARCLLSPQYGDPEYLALPAIGEGHGDLVAVTWTVTNIAGKPLHRAVAYTTVQLVTSRSVADWGC